MKIEILGSGGATLTPRPFSQTRVSQTAREKGHPYTRMGPSYFIHDINLLIDTPEEIVLMLERSGIQKVDAALYSHWHPDHTAGMRVWEANQVLWTDPPQVNTTDVYLPTKVSEDFKQWLALSDRFTYLENFLKVVRQIHLQENESITLEDITIRPILLSAGYVYAFLCTQGGINILIVPDEAFQWVPPTDLPELDLLIIPAGLFEFNPFTGSRIIPANHTVLKSESTFRQTLDIVRKINARQVIMAHIEEVNELDYDDLVQLSEKLRTENPELPPITFAYDMQILELP